MVAVTDQITLFQAEQDALDHVAECIAAMHELGIKKAEAEREYRILKQKRMLYERHKGTPVTIIQDVVKGSQDVADLLFARECTVSEYDANYEAILYWKLRVNTIRDQIKREWSQAAEQ